MHDVSLSLANRGIYSNVVFSALFLHPFNIDCDKYDMGCHATRYLGRPLLFVCWNQNSSEEYNIDATW